jgi:hypothetical protein
MIIQRYYNEEGYSNCFIAKQGKYIAYGFNLADAIKRLIAIIRSVQAWNK